MSQFEHHAQDDRYVDFHEITKIYKNIPFYKIYVEKIPTKKYLYQKSVPLLKQVFSYKTLEESIYCRTTSRSFISDKPTGFEEFSALMFLSCHTNKNHSEGNRAYPSAGARYPLEVYPIIFNVESLHPGIYFYDQAQHNIVRIKKGDFRSRINTIIQQQNFPLECSFGIVITAVFERTISKYGERGYRYVFLEAGHLSQNFYLVSSALDIGCAAIGGFYDQSLDRLIGLHDQETSIYMSCFGEIKKV